jgi:predicted transcriptional regulator
MTDKEIVQDLLRRVPDSASLQEIAKELEFIAAVRQGMTELDNGESFTIEEVEQALPSWIIK